MWRTALVSAGFVIVAAACASWLTEGFRVWTAEGARRLAVATHAVVTPPALLDGPGLSGRDLRDVLGSSGQVTLVNFIYTRCNSVCLGLGAAFQQLQTQLARDRVAAVQLLSISFDPAHDDAAALAQYARQQRADPARWRFATVPDPRALQRLLDAFQVVVVPDGQGGYVHNAALLVIDERGRLVRVFDDTDLDGALAWALSIKPAGGAP